MKIDSMVFRYFGAQELIEALEAAGKQLAVLTNKNGEAARSILLT